MFKKCLEAVFTAALIAGWLVVVRAADGALQVPAPAASAPGPTAATAADLPGRG